LHSHKFNNFVAFYTGSEALNFGDGLLRALYCSLDNHIRSWLKPRGGA